MDVFKPIDCQFQRRNMNRGETNKFLRASFNKILNHEPDERELELRELARKEREEYLQRKEVFYNNPLHWSNNKRRRNGLSVLRGSANKKDRSHFSSFHPSPFLYGIFEDILEDKITDKFSNDQFFNQFVDYRNLNIGDCDVMYYERTDNE